MSADHLQFLKNKFNKNFGEAVEEFSNELPLLLHFQEILKVLEQRRITSSTPIKMKNLLYDLDYFLVECVMLAEKEREYLKAASQNTKKNRFNARYVKKLWFLSRNGKRLVRILKKLKEVRDDDATFSEDRLHSSKDWFSVNGDEDLLQFDADKMYGFDDHFQKIHKKLLQEITPDDGIGMNAIGIVGMSGVGKTALARMVFESRQVFQKFIKIWVRLSDNFKPHGNDLEEEIFRRLNYQKPTNILIVLDNISHLNEWYFDLVSKLRPTIVIITCRFEDVASRMVGEQNLHRIQPELNEESCWKIFMGSIKRKQFIESEHYPILVRMKDEIVYRCDGLPLAAKTLAEIISFQIAKKEDWSDSRVAKLILLKLDVHEEDLFLLALSRIGTISVPAASDRETRGLGQLKVRTSFLFEILKELKNICHTELLSIE